MPVDIVQWHVEIGIFNGHLNHATIKVELNLFNIASCVRHSLGLAFAVILQ